MGCLLESDRLVWVPIQIYLLPVYVCGWGCRGYRRRQRETKTKRDRDMERQKHVYLSSIVLVYRYNNIYPLTSFQLFPLAVESSISVE